MRQRQRTIINAIATEKDHTQLSYAAATVILSFYSERSIQLHLRTLNESLTESYSICSILIISSSQIMNYYVSYIHPV